MIRSTPFRAGLAAALALSAALPAAATELLSPLPAMARPAAGADRVVRALETDRTTATLQLVAVDAAAVATDAPRLSLALAPGVEIEARRDRGYANDDGTVVWIGTARKPGARGAAGVHDAGNAVVLVRNGDKVAGTVRRDGRLFRLEPLAGAGHALVEIDEAAWPADHPPETATPAGLGVLAPPPPFTPPPAANVPRRAPNFNPPAQAARTRIDAMVVITDAAAAMVGDVPAFVQLAVAETNQGYRNSQVPIDMVLVGTWVDPYVTVDFNTDLSRFAGTTDGFLDQYHARRNEVAADVAVLLIRDPAYQYCGLGYLNASAAYAFSVTEHRCATGNYTFAHEVGHNQGAHHDVANGNNTAFPYGHGFQNPAQGWRTIMAYACSGVSCPKINHWSNPKRTYNGVLTGDGRSDNARVLTERRQAVAGFR